MTLRRLEHRQVTHVHDLDVVDQVASFDRRCNLHGVQRPDVLYELRELRNDVVVAEQQLGRTSRHGTLDELDVPPVQDRYVGEHALLHGYT